MIEYTPPFSLAGEAGRALDATPRTLEALGICNPVLGLTSLAMDTLSFSIPRFMVLHLPDDGQEVSLTDAVGRVLFRGKVKRGYSLAAEVYHFKAENAWKKLSNAPLQGMSDTRPFRVYPSQQVGIRCDRGHLRMLSWRRPGPRNRLFISRGTWSATIAGMMIGTLACRICVRPKGARSDYLRGIHRGRGPPAAKAVWAATRPVP